MSRANIPLQKTELVSKFSKPAATASMLTALTADGAEIKWDERDDKIMLLVQNTGTAAVTVTVKAGNGIQGVSDESISLPAGNYAFIRLESGRFKNVSGDLKGKVILTGSTDVKVAAFMHP